jgi:hypothetical protein
MTMFTNSMFWINMDKKNKQATCHLINIPIFSRERFKLKLPFLAYLPRSKSTYHICISHWSRTRTPTLHISQKWCPLQQFCNQMMSSNKIGGVGHKLYNIESIWGVKSRDLTYIVQANFTMHQIKIYKHHNSIILTLKINSKFVCSLTKQKYHHAPNHRGLRT